MSKSSFLGPVDVYHFSGALAFTQALDAEAVIDGGTVDQTKITRFNLDTNGLAAEDHVYLSGTTSFDGFHKLMAVATNTFDINATYVAETAAGSKLVSIALDSDWEWIGLELALSAARSGAENLTVTVNADRGSAWDTTLYTKDMDGVVDLVYYPDLPIILSAADVLDLAWANADTLTYGLKVLARRLA